MMTEVSVFDGLNVSRETFESLKTYEGLVKKWNPHINLVSKKTIDAVWERHILDSAQLFAVIDNKPHIYADFGSGGGFPGIVLAILFAEKSPKTIIRLVESDKRKSEFLRTVSRELNLNIQVLSERIENLDAMNADLITARALAPLDKLLSFVHMHLNPSGTALLPKGNSYQEEVKVAMENWHFDLSEKPSMTDTNATILKIGALSRA